MPLTVNLNKAKEIAHNTRRKLRNLEFQPHDAVIARQIPDNSSALAEAARQDIRAKYAVIQAEIDAASTVGEVDEKAVALSKSIPNRKFS